MSIAASLLYLLSLLLWLSFQRWLDKYWRLRSAGMSTGANVFLNNGCGNVDFKVECVARGILFAASNWIHLERSIYQSFCSCL